MGINDAEMIANLEAIAIVGLIVRNEGDEGAAIMANESEDPVRLARAACGMAAAVLVALAPDRAELFLDGFRQNAFERLAGS
ncbi:hypothetical protein CVO76_10415 [Arthrobacter agilis]|uniref:Uncharacterized protein n=1 Tax=Arthrobacter agilis TaxID=37921 RepID=A0A2L0UFG4_9MICC|nr:hypothetical protein [Arthrobacter agilis]AUZ87994.1 hypothetical protein CVO76_10415 [Arthrobacter agilis]